MYKSSLNNYSSTTFFYYKTKNILNPQGPYTWYAWTILLLIAKKKLHKCNVIVLEQPS